MKKAGLVASLVLALGSGGLAHLYFLRLSAEVSGGPKVPVLVAAADIPVGGALTEDSLVVRDVPQAYVEGRNVRAAEVKKVVGARVAAGLKANEPLLWTDLEKFNEHARVLSGLIENGMRAVVVDGKMVDFDGLLRPGDRVDVIFTAGDKDKGSQATVTLLQNLLVLSTGGSIARVDDDAKARARSSSVSLSVTSEQAEKIMLATQQGKLMLSLRNPEDIAIVEGAPTTTVKDLGAANPSSTPLAREVVLEKERIDHVR